MSTTQARSSDTSGTTSVKNVDMKLEVITTPVSDVPDGYADYMVREQAGMELPS